MSRPMLTTLALTLVAFGVGLAMGHYFQVAGADQSVNPGPSHFSGNGEAWTDPGTNDVHANTVLSARIRELENQVVAQRQVQNNALAERLAFFKKYHNEIRIQNFTGSPVQITPEMIAVLGLTKDEQQAVEQHLQEAEDEMAKMQTAGTTLQHQTSNSFTLEIPANPAGQLVQAKLTDEVAGDIGSERAGFLFNAVEPSYNDTFSGFAEQKIGWDVSWSEQNGALSYSVKETSNRPDGTAPSWSSFTTDRLPKELQPFVQSAAGP